MTALPAVVLAIILGAVAVRQAIIDVYSPEYRGGYRNIRQHQTAPHQQQDMQQQPKNVQ